MNQQIDLAMNPRRCEAVSSGGLTFHGTHRDEFAGIAPTGKAITARGVQVARFENGRIVKRRGSSDELGILKQLGARVAR